MERVKIPVIKLEDDYKYSTSRLAFYHHEIKNLIDKGCSVRSAWRVINAELIEDGNEKVSSTNFARYVGRYVKI